jgi:uncharacterized membrane protein YcaP (DUF421 family)
VDLWRIAVRAVVAYVYLLVSTRASGKRVVSQATPLDLMMSLIVGDLIDDMIWTEVSLAKFGVAVVTIGICECVAKLAGYYSPRAYAVLNGTPRVVLRDGVADGGALRREQMNEKDLAHLLRLRGIEDWKRVQLASVETNHEASAILQPQEEQAAKQDAPKVKERMP